MKWLNLLSLVVALSLSCWLMINNYQSAYGQFSEQQSRRLLQEFQQQVQSKSLHAGEIRSVCKELRSQSSHSLWRQKTIFASKDPDSLAPIHRRHYDLQRGLRSAPRLQDWARFLERVERAKENKGSVHVVLLSGSSASLLKPWSSIMFQAKGFSFGSRDQPSFQLTSILIPGMTTSFAQRLWVHPIIDQFPVGVDLLVDAMAKQDMARLLWEAQDGTDPLLVQTPNAARKLHRIKERWIRSIVTYDRSPCPGSALLWIADNHVGCDGVMTDSLYLRTVQRLTEWYSVPMTSIGAVLRPLLYEKSCSQEIMDDACKHEEGSMGYSLAHDMLSATIAFCEQKKRSTADTKKGLLFPEKVQEMVADSIPPVMSLSLSNQNISAIWNQQFEERGSSERCATTRQTRSMSHWIYLEWNSDGETPSVLRLSKTNRKWKQNVEEVQTRNDRSVLEIWVDQFQDGDKKAETGEARVLEIVVSTEGISLLSDTISLTKSSARPLVLEHKFNLLHGPRQTSFPLSIEMNLLQGSSVRIVGILLHSESSS